MAIKLDITHTETYRGTITIDEQQVKNLTQGFDEKGYMNGAMGEFIVNRDLYYANVTECRKQEDAFRDEMRKIEDSRVQQEVQADETEKQAS